MKHLYILLAVILGFQSYAQDNSTVTLIVSGQGKSEDEAKQIALRSAIEQAFGTFISSETVINNDSFVSDNITSLSQGSVLNFEVLSSNRFPDNSISLTMKAVVSITEMQKLTQSQGHSATIAGGLFGMNLKLLKLQSEAEARVIDDMSKKSLLILQESIDFNLEIEPPIKSDLREELQAGLYEGSYEDYWKNTRIINCDNMYRIRFTVECRPNSNLDVFIDYFINTLNSIKMSDSEIDFARKSGTKFFELKHYNGSGESFYLRNKRSVDLIAALFQASTLNLVNYDIISNDDILKFTPIFKNGSITYSDENYDLLRNKNFNYEKDIEILDSNHYFFLHGFLNTRKIAGQYEMHRNYPSDLYEDVWGAYGFQLNKGISDSPLTLSSSDRVISHYCLYFDGPGNKVTPIKDHMNVRYQVIDYFLPLSDVERLNTIEIKRHN